MKKLVLSLLAATILASAAGLCPAETEPKPLVTVAFSGYDKLLSNVEMIGKLGGNPNLHKMLEMMLTMVTQGKGLAGLDKKQPWGAVLLPDEQQTIVVFGFLPVVDFKQLMEVVKSNSSLGKIEEKDGVYEIPTPAFSLYIAQKGHWAVIARNADDFARAPADPAKLFGDLASRYDLAARLSIKDIPAPLRASALAAMQAGMQMGLEQMPNEADQEHALRSAAVRQGMQQMTTLLNESDNLTVGWKVDHAAKTSYLDVEVTAKPGTHLAQQYAQIQPGKTAFAGFASPQAAVSGTWVTKLDDADVAQAKVALTEMRKRVVSELEKQNLSEGQIKLAKQLLTDALAVLEKTVEAKKLNGGLLVDLEPGKVTLLAGGTVAGGAKLDQILKQLVEEVKKDQPAVEDMVKLNAETYDGVRFHTLSVPSADPGLTRIFGDTLDVVLGVADDRVYIAAGHEPAKKLKAVLDRSKANRDQELLPMRISFALRPIAKFLSELAEEENVKAKAAALAGALKQTDGNDHLVLTTSPTANGFRVRLEAQPGLLKVVGALAPNLAAPGAGVAPADQ